MSTKFYAVGVNRGVKARRDFDPTDVPSGPLAIDRNDWVVSAGCATLEKAMDMATNGQRAVKGAQDFFVMEHEDGKPVAYYALPRTVKDEDVDAMAKLASLEHLVGELTKTGMPTEVAEWLAKEIVDQMAANHAKGTCGCGRDHSEEASADKAKPVLRMLSKGFTRPRGAIGYDN